MVSPAEIVEVTENVVHTVLGCDVTPVDAPQDPTVGDPVAGCIQIAGEWTGAVIVYTSGRLAHEAASKMLAIPAEKVEGEDIQDALAELTNMVGGNIKSLVPGPSLLGLPSVTTGQDLNIRVYGTRVENHVYMQCNGETLNVVLCRGPR